MRKIFIILVFILNCFILNADLQYILNAKKNYQIYLGDNKEKIFKSTLIFNKKSDYLFEEKTRK